MVYGMNGVCNALILSILCYHRFLEVLTVPCFGICDIGKQIYTRTCTPPIAGGMICAGPTQREEACDLTQPCPGMRLSID